MAEARARSWEDPSGVPCGVSFPKRRLVFPGN